MKQQLKEWKKTTIWPAYNQVHWSCKLHDFDLDFEVPSAIQTYSTYHEISYLVELE